ncbi:MAG TPA: glycosyltransferase [Solirubrobacterales bacterium]|nr:glycosyltransferase [Solirubrobacterales bacterium]
MIFVTVGTHHQPFQRLLDGLEDLGEQDLVVQFGSGREPARAARAAAFMPFDEIVSYFREAEKVITHAGVGSIICARREGHLPLVVPRRADLGEHVDEHQVELSAALSERGSVISVEDVADLRARLDAAPSRRPPAELEADDLGAAVRSALLG